MSRPTKTEIDLGALQHNFNLLRQMVGDKVRMLPVVKADAYGHGIKEVSLKLVSCGADYFGVATVDEGVTLRKFFKENLPANKDISILVLGAILPEEADAVLKYDIVQTVADKDVVSALSQKAKRQGRPAKVHVKVDTGMGRIGVWHEDAVDFIKWVKGLDAIDIEGIWTHLSSADDDDPSFTNEQIYIFRQLVKDLNAIGIDIPLRHVANSMAVIGFEGARLNLVRPGLVMYGLYPRNDLKEKVDFKPVMSLKTKIVFLKDVPSGRHISYGRKFTTVRPTKIATLPIGYGDGYPRILSNRASVLIRGERAGVVGTICMDQIMVEVGHIGGVKAGDEVVLLGRQGRQEISAEELAGLAGTIPYEIVCSIAPRVPRVYIDNEKNYTHAEKIRRDAQGIGVS